MRLILPCVCQQQNQEFSVTTKTIRVLHMAAQYSGDPDLVQYLVENGEDINAVNADGASVIDYAEMNTNSDVHATLVDLQRPSWEVAQANEDADEDNEATEEVTEVNDDDEQQQASRGWAKNRGIVHFRFYGKHHAWNDKSSFFE